MSLTERQRLCMLGLLLSATVALATVSGGESDGSAVVEPVARKGTAHVPSSGLSTKSAPLNIASIVREPLESVEVDIFRPKSWQPPAPPPPKTEAPPAPVKPTAPALPFTYAGQLGDPATGKVIIYLSTPQRVHTVQVGEVIDEKYRLEAIEDGRLTFEYLPLKVRQVLAIPLK